MELIKHAKILIVGLGLMGGSYAQALSRVGFEVGAIARRQETLDFAQEKGWIRHGRTYADESYIKNFDIVVFALYPKVFIKWIKKNQNCLKSGALLTDVTGVKSSVVYEIQNMLRSDLEFVGAHPMAGREVSGVENADRTIFYDANYIVTPTRKNTPEGIAACKQLGRIMGFRTVTELPPEEHDEMIGFLSQLTHCIAVALMVCKDSKELVDYTGDSFRDLTRIAKINDVMWTELFLLNKTELLAQMDLFHEKFMELRDDIAREDTEAIRAMMRESKKHREYFDKR